MSLTRRPVSNRQASQTELLLFRVDASEVPAVAETNRNSAVNRAALPEGFSQATVAKAASVFTFNLHRTSLRTPVIVGVEALPADRLIGEVTVTNDIITVKTTDLAGVAADADFHLTVIRFDNSRIY